LVFTKVLHFCYECCHRICVCTSLALTRECPTESIYEVLFQVGKDAWIDLRRQVAEPGKGCEDMATYIAREAQSVDVVDGEERQLEDDE